MITLYTFGPAFGLPDPSPFVMKAEVLLKMAGLLYRTDTKGLRRAPKGKLPYIEDDGERIADSTFIRWHIEKKYGIDFDRGLPREEQATAWAFEKLAEDHLYWRSWRRAGATTPISPKARRSSSAGFRRRCVPSWSP
jgi:glutathione S-transferase